MPFWASHLIWRLSPTINTTVLIVDYTVPSLRFSHHNGLIWLLNHFRVRAPKGADKWHADRDYVGYNPTTTTEHHRVWERNLDPYDWVYVADTYGVYDIDVLKEGDPERHSLRVPKLLFGALTMKDMQALSSFTEKGGNIFFEFNSFSEPTAPEVRAAAEALTGVTWTGWTGRFFQDLSDLESIPPWLPRLYKAQYNGQNLPQGPGILLVNEVGRVVVLSGERFEKSAPILNITSTGKRMYPRTYGTPPYFGWFSLVNSRAGVDVLAEIILPTPSPAWEKAYQMAKIPIVSPLLTQLSMNNSNRFYMAANLSNLDNAPDVYRLAGVSLLQAAVHRRRDSVSEMPAYWQLYVPAVSEILIKSAE